MIPVKIEIDKEDLYTILEMGGVEVEKDPDYDALQSKLYEARRIAEIAEKKLVEAEKENAKLRAINAEYRSILKEVNDNSIQQMRNELAASKSNKESIAQAVARELAALTPEERAYISQVERK